MNENEFSVLTYNVAFHLGLEKQRTKALIDLINFYKPTIICLQEMTKFMFNTLRENLSNDYRPNRELLLYKYGLAIFTNKSLNVLDNKIIFYQSFQERELNWVKFKLAGHEMTIATTHLESEFPHKNFKLTQFQQMFESLEDHVNSIICGDMNIIEEDEEKFVLPKNWWDAWEKDGKKKEIEYSYNIELNEFVEGPYRTRLDRIFVKSKDLQIEHLELIKGEYKEKQWISDHFGYLAKFSFKDFD